MVGNHELKVHRIVKLGFCNLEFLLALQGCRFMQKCLEIAEMRELEMIFFFAKKSKRSTGSYLSSLHF